MPSLIRSTPFALLPLAAVLLVAPAALAAAPITLLSWSLTSPSCKMTLTIDATGLVTRANGCDGSAPTTETLSAADLAALQANLADATHGPFVKRYPQPAAANVAFTGKITGSDPSDATGSGIVPAPVMLGTYKAPAPATTGVVLINQSAGAQALLTQLQSRWHFALPTSSDTLPQQ